MRKSKSKSPILVLTVLATIAPAAAFLACDPDLAIVTRPGTDGGTNSEGGTSTSSSGNPADPKDGAAAGSEDGGDAGTIVPEEDSGVPPVPTHTIDGTNDFTAGEKFPTSSSTPDLYEGYIAWDKTNLYFGMSGPDVGSASADRWVQIYLGVPGLPGTRTGVDYNGQQQPTLPFDATHHLRWKTSGDYYSVEVYDPGTTSWKTGAASLVPPKQQATFMETAIPRAALLVTAKIAVVMNMLVEHNSADWTYAGVPSTAFTDKKDPDFTKYFEFDLTDTAKAPNTYAPK
jgi:hypothetical protein